MPTNEQRRATAKRKLERQLERRAKQARTRRILLIVGGAIAARRRHRGGGDHRRQHQQQAQEQHRVDDRAAQQRRRSAASSASPSEPATHAAPLPPFQPSASVGANCQYQATPQEPAAKPVKPPRTGKVPTDPAQRERQHGDQPGQPGSAAGEQRIAVHRQQLRQPDRPEVLRQHEMPPADDVGIAGRLAMRRPEGRRHRRSRLPVRQRIPDRPVPGE